MRVHNKTRRTKFAVLTMALLFSAAFGGVAPVEASELATADGVAQGSRLYRKACAACHGVRGDGKGPASEGLVPAPRDFTSGIYKWRSSVSGALPTDADIARTVRKGASGTSMPAWGNILSPADIEAVISYVKTFSPAFADPDQQLTAEDRVEIPRTRPFPRTSESESAGRTMYQRMGCAACHGETGRGDGKAAEGLSDDWGNPIRPYDLTRGIFRSGNTDQDLYRTFTTGVNGTPMPAFGQILSDEERWQLVDYIRSISVAKGLVYRLFVERP